MKGINIVVTYKCNIKCSLCKYNCGPHRKGMMGIKNFKNEVEKAYNEGFNNYIIIEGGEPLLEPATTYKYLKSVWMLKADKYIISNGFWGNADIYIDILEDLKKVGLKGIIFEYNFFHSIFININVLRDAALMCMKAGIEVIFKADFISGNIKNQIDIKTFEYVKSIKREFRNAKFIFVDFDKNTRIFGRSYLKEEKVIFYQVPKLY